MATIRFFGPRIGGDVLPRFVCEQCRQPVWKVAEAMLFKVEPQEYGDIGTAAVVLHKGDCDALWQQAHLDADPGCLELETAIVLLGLGGGMQPAEFDPERDGEIDDTYRSGERDPYRL